jgi:hypothetical protein
LLISAESNTIYFEDYDQPSFVAVLVLSNSMSLEIATAGKPFVSSRASGRLGDMIAT